MPIPWNEVWQLVITIAAGVVTLSAAGSWVAKLFSPYKKLVKQQDELRQEIAALKQQNEHYEKLFERDLERFKRNDEKDTIMFDVLFALLEHARTNNSKGLMEAASKKLQAFLIERK